MAPPSARNAAAELELEVIGRESPDICDVLGGIKKIRRATEESNSLYRLNVCDFTAEIPDMVYK